MSPLESVVGNGQDIPWEWLKFIKEVLSLSEMSFLPCFREWVRNFSGIPLFPPLPICSGSLGFLRLRHRHRQPRLRVGRSWHLAVAA